MLEAVLGNATAEKVLLYIESYGEGYAQAIANTFDDVTLRMAQVQLPEAERRRYFTQRRCPRRAGKPL